MKGKFQLITGSVSEVETTLNKMIETNFVKVITSTVDTKGILIMTLYVKPLTTKRNGEQ